MKENFVSGVLPSRSRAGGVRKTIWTRQGQNYFCGKGFDLASADSDLVGFGFRRAGGCGRNARRISFCFLTAGLYNNSSVYVIKQTSRKFNNY
jgi:hypothetical protein